METKLTKQEQEELKCKYCGESWNNHRWSEDYCDDGSGHTFNAEEEPSPIEKFCFSCGKDDDLLFFSKDKGSIHQICKECKKNLNAKLAGNEQ